MLSAKLTSIVRGFPVVVVVVVGSASIETRMPPLTDGELVATLPILVANASFDSINDLNVDELASLEYNNSTLDFGPNFASMRT